MVAILMYHTPVAWWKHTLITYRRLPRTTWKGGGSTCPNNHLTLLRHNCTIAQLHRCFETCVISKSFRNRFKTFRNSKMLLRSGTFRNTRYPAKAYQNPPTLGAVP